MTGPTDDFERQPSAAQSTSSTTLPINDTDDYIHQMMVRLSPHEDVIRRNRPGKPKFYAILLIQHNI